MLVSWGGANGGQLRKEYEMMYFTSENGVMNAPRDARIHYSLFDSLRVRHIRESTAASSSSVLDPHTDFCRRRSQKLMRLSKKLRRDHHFDRDHQPLPFGLLLLTTHWYSYSLFIHHFSCCCHCQSRIVDIYYICMYTYNESTCR